MDASAAVIANPILRGFNPDPSIVRVGDDYYIATSTFEWFPGVQIHHSRDLVYWRLIARPLNRASQLDMRGDPDSCGVWAPCLTHADGLFHLIYTDVKRYGRTTTAGASGASLRDFHNYLVTSPRIDGEWSDPVYLNSSGFDPSLFHDDDGRKYLVNMLWDHRPGQNRFAGIVLQEYSPATRTLVGERHNIFSGTAIGLTEAPHLYKRDGWYYLLTAEGGTGWGHAVTMARSRTLFGPYELREDRQVEDGDLGVQDVGHETHEEQPGRRVRGQVARLEGRARTRPQRLPRQPEQIGRAQPSQDIVGKGNGHEDRGEAGRGGEHVHQETRGDAEQRNHTGALTLAQGARHEVDHVRPRREHHDEGSEREQGEIARRDQLALAIIRTSGYSLWNSLGCLRCCCCCCG